VRNASADVIDEADLHLGSEYCSQAVDEHAGLLQCVFALKGLVAVPR
jgi:hypothetical protein